MLTREQIAEREADVKKQRERAREIILALVRAVYSRSQSRGRLDK